MNYQWLPFGTILFMLLWNWRRKRKFFCVSTLVLFYVASAFGTAIYIADKPRTGDTFIDPDAMIYLSVAMFFLCLPAIFFGDGKKQLPLLNVENKEIMKIAKPLICITVPASLFFLLRAIPILLTFLRGGLDRAAFRDTLDIASMGGSSSPFIFMLTFCACFSCSALFLSGLGLAFNTFKLKYSLLLLFGGLAFSFDTLKTASRSVLFNNMMFVAITALILLPQTNEKQRILIKKYLIWFFLIALLPFIYITLKRFDSDFVYSLLSYFGTGPYSFSTDYAGRTSGAPCTWGYITASLPTILCDLFFGTNMQAHGKMIMREEYSTGISETQQLYSSISGAYCGEFKTAVGSFLLDYSPELAMTLIILLSLLFVIFFSRKRYCKISTMFGAAFYFTILALSPIGWPFVEKNNGLVLVLSFMVLIWLRKIESRELKRRRSASAMQIQKENSEPPNGGPENGEAKNC